MEKDNVCIIKKYLIGIILLYNCLFFKEFDIYNIVYIFKG